MLIFAAIVPHSPLLIPALGKENLAKLEQTKHALEELAADLYTVNPETLIIITPHGLNVDQNFVLQLAPKFEGDLQEFGDLETKLQLNADISFINKLRMNAETTLPITVVNETKIDYGVFVPLYYLTQNLPNVKLVIVAASGLSNDDHYIFGKYLKKQIIRSNKRIALLVSGDLAQSLSKEAPTKYSPQGKKFDKNFLVHLKQNDFKKLFDLDPQIVEKSQQCVLKPALILAGIMDKLQATPQLLSYEHPFGVGQMVMKFNL